MTHRSLTHLGNDFLIPGLKEAMWTAWIREKALTSQGLVTTESLFSQTVHALYVEMREASKLDIERQIPNAPS